ncbi:MAG: hypothetical protein WCP32_08980 [Bacteroidota bacterium]
MKPCNSDSGSPERAIPCSREIQTVLFLLILLCDASSNIRGFSCNIEKSVLCIFLLYHFDYLCERISVIFGGFCEKTCRLSLFIFFHSRNRQRIIKGHKITEALNAEPFKLWLAQVGSDRLDEIENPELTPLHSRELHKTKGYPDANESYLPEEKNKKELKGRK